ncbi:hypothetical protein P9139_06560 [Curtobacterium flaccumfaciens]|nr:hypothetical protein P9139_06560 [Curtobacterium flaccumfaciens]
MSPGVLSSRGRSVLAATALVVGLLAITVGALIFGAHRIGDTIANGAHVISRPSSGAFGQCRNQMPWSCDAVPEGTVEAEFGRTIQAGWTMLAAEADPVAGVTGTAQIQVLFEAPVGTDVSGWLSLADTTQHFATSAPAPQLADLGVTSIDGGSSGFTKVYTGGRDGRVYVWAYKRL